MIFATSDRREAEARMRQANSKLSDATVSRVGQLVEDGAIRVGDAMMHAPGSIFTVRDLTFEEQVEIASINDAAIAETLAR